MKYGARHLKRAIEHTWYPLASLLAPSKYRLGDVIR